jgi:hypothetical protein
MTSKLPGWIEARDGQRVLIPAREATIRLIGSLALDGLGDGLIVQRLNRDGVATWARGKRWTRSTVHMLLTDRRLLGEHQPHDIAGAKAGDLIPGYYPAVYEEAEFDAIQAARASRRQPRGRPSRQVNPFAGLLTHARDGMAYHVLTRTAHGASTRILLNRSGMDTTGRSYSFPADVFERHLRAELTEVNPADVLEPGHHDQELDALVRQEDSILAQIGECKALLKAHPSATLAALVAEHEAALQAIRPRIRAVKQRLASPTGDAWAKGKPLLAMPEDRPETPDERLKVQATLSRILDEVFVLVVPRGHARLAAVQVRFRDGARSRTYLMLHLPPKANQSARQDGDSWCCSFPGQGEYDLREPADVRAVEAFLKALPLSRSGPTVAPAGPTHGRPGR